MNGLMTAIMQAGKDLAENHDWCFDGEIGQPPDEDNPFVTVVYNHVIKVVGNDWKKERIKALKAELALLEGE
jgi:hypothetical protein